MRFIEKSSDLKQCDFSIPKTQSRVFVIEPTTLAYIAGFLDGDGSIFFQIVPRSDYKYRFEIRASVAFYQKKSNVEILNWLKKQIGAGYIRHRKTGISDYTVVGSVEVKKILLLLQPYVRLKSQQVALGLEILKQIENLKSKEDFLNICKLVDKFKELNYSKKRKHTYAVVKESFDSTNKSLPL